MRWSFERQLDHRRVHAPALAPGDLQDEHVVRVVVHGEPARRRGRPVRVGLHVGREPDAQPRRAAGAAPAAGQSRSPALRRRSSPLRRNCPPPPAGRAPTPRQAPRAHARASSVQRQRQPRRRWTTHHRRATARSRSAFHKARTSIKRPASLAPTRRAGIDRGATQNSSSATGAAELDQRVSAGRTLRAAAGGTRPGVRVAVGLRSAGRRWRTAPPR